MEKARQEFPLLGADVLSAKRPERLPGLGLVDAEKAGEPCGFPG